MRARSLFTAGALAALLLWPQWLGAQAVIVTARLDRGLVPAGGSTTLRIAAQIAPGQRTNAAGILSWYIDVLNPRPGIAAANYGAMTKPASDNDPFLSSTGVSAGGSRHGIYDTFLDRPGAGITSPVELLAVPIQVGNTSGAVRFQVSAGSGVPELGADFLVEPLDTGPPLVGGDYTIAVAELLVCDPRLRIERATESGAQQRATLRFDPCPGADIFIESRPSLGASAWQTLAGGPHNTGSLTVTNLGTDRFFRLRVQPQ